MYVLVDVGKSSSFSEGEPEKKWFIYMAIFQQFSYNKGNVIDQTNAIE